MQNLEIRAANTLDSWDFAAHLGSTVYLAAVLWEVQQRDILAISLLYFLDYIYPPPGAHNRSDGKKCRSVNSRDLHMMDVLR